VFAVVLVFIVSSAALLLTRLAPGDYATGALGLDAGRERIEEMRARYGLDRPIGEQYGQWMMGALRFDFGRSLRYDRAVGDLIPERAANTAILAIAALTAATLIGFPLGIFTGSRRGGLLTAVIRAT